MKTIAVIIPVRNGAPTLRACLASVCQQTYPAEAIIVVDNASTDDTTVIIADAAKLDPRVRRVAVEKIGRGVARAAGARHTAADLTVMLDADCTAPPDWLETITRPLREENEHIVQGAWHASNTGFWPRQLQQADELFLKSQTDGQYINHLSTRNLAITTSVLRQFPFDPDLTAAEDLDIYVRLRTTVKVRFLPTCAVNTLHTATTAAAMRTHWARGYWWAVVYAKHQADTTTRSLPQFASLQPANMLLSPFRIWSHFLTKPFGHACFILLTEIPWRLGIVCFHLRHCFGRPQPPPTLLPPDTPPHHQSKPPDHTAFR